MTLPPGCLQGRLEGKAGFVTLGRTNPERRVRSRLNESGRQTDAVQELFYKEFYSFGRDSRQTD